MAKKNLPQLGAYIKELRLEYPYKSAELADKAQVSQSYISDLENGKKKAPKLEILERIATALTDKMEDSEKIAVYNNILNYAGLRSTRNQIAHGTKNDEDQVIPLADFLKQLDNELTGPLEKNEFCLSYRESEKKEYIVRGMAKSFNDLYDLANIGESMQVVTKEGGLTIYGESKLYYKGRMLTSDEIAQVKKIIEALLDK